MPAAKPYDGAARKQAETEVREIIERWARAVREGGRQSILANHSEDILMFDFPDVSRDRRI
jgi:ketosteroid isomerase-like protein